MSPIRVEVFERFEDAEPRWRHYQGRFDHYVYQTFDWISHWHEHIGGRRGISVCLVDIRGVDDTPLAFLPLGIEKRWLGSALIWLGGDIADYHGPILTPEGSVALDTKALDHLWAILRREIPSLTHADFKRQPAKIGGLVNPFAKVGRKAEEQLALSTKLTEDWTRYYAAKRGKKTRHNDRRKRRRLESMGTLSFAIASTPEEIDTQVTAMLEQKNRYVMRLGQTNNLLQRGQADFLKQLTMSRTIDQTTILCALNLDDDILAVQWGIVHRGRLYSIIASYDDGPLSRLSTGDILLRELLAWCFDNEVDVVDFTCGDEPYKLAWCDQSLDLQDRLLPLSPFGHAAVITKLFATRIRHWAGSSPALRSAVAGLRNRTRSGNSAFSLHYLSPPTPNRSEHRLTPGANEAMPTRNRIPENFQARSSKTPTTQ